jgi:hypothetical protein
MSRAFRQARHMALHHCCVNAGESEQLSPLKLSLERAPIVQHVPGMLGLERVKGIEPSS